jgi:hypothetical protein
MEFSGLVYIITYNMYFKSEQSEDMYPVVEKMNLTRVNSRYKTILLSNVKLFKV